MVMRTETDPNEGLSIRCGMRSCTKACRLPRLTSSPCVSVVVSTRVASLPLSSEQRARHPEGGENLIPSDLDLSLLNVPKE